MNSTNDEPKGPQVDELEAVLREHADALYGPLNAMLVRAEQRGYERGKAEGAREELESLKETTYATNDPFLTEMLDYRLHHLTQPTQGEADEQV